MADYYVYAWDSSSTPKLESVNFKRLDTLMEFIKNVKKTQKERLVAAEPQRELIEIFMHWNENLSGAPGDTTSEYLHQNNKFGERKANWIIRYLKDKYLVNSSNKIEMLYIVTDGAMSKESVEECIELNEDMHYGTIVFHAFNANPKKNDLSVAAPFLRSRCMVYRNNKLCYGAEIFKKLNYDKINADNILAVRDQLKTYIELKYINKSISDTGVSEGIKKLTMLRKRVYKEFSAKLTKYIHSPADLKANEANSLTPKIDFTAFWKCFFATLATQKEVDETFADMLECIQNKKNSCSFDALNFDEKNDKPVADEPMDNADSIDNDAQSMDDNDDADSMNDDADYRDHGKKKFFMILQKHKEGMSIFQEYLDIMHR
uniref:Uncharacterized protein n=1 Tax=Glyptapanteles flavicoxis TaxID=463051 RepID=B7S8G8_9HYME|nr:conserved hypothetical protein [Glyptapanteles flavicoxis]